MPLSRLRFPLLALAILMLILATLAGLMRLGWKVPTINGVWMAAHGPLMLSGFLGTLISLERAVAMGKRWMYMGPFLSALGGIALLLGLPAVVAQGLIVLGSVGLIMIFGEIVRRQIALYTVTMTIGAIAWLVGNLVWASGGHVSDAVLWWAGFLILTIAGERLELGRLFHYPRAVLGWFIGACVLFIAGGVIALGNFAVGVKVSGVGMIALGLWLLRYDVARKTVRKAGVTRFIAMCMLSGYGWLLIGGALGLAYGGATAGMKYDAWLHAIFLGFVFSMIFGHATIIFPAILGRLIQFSPRFYVHWGLLHASLIVRLMGDLTDLFVVRRWGGLLNGIALLIFFGNTVWAVLDRQK